MLNFHKGVKQLYGVWGFLLKTSTEDLAAGGACDIWYLATGVDGGRGRDADWDAIKKSGVQHFKMVLTEPEEAPYIWDKEPRLARPPSTRTPA